MTRLDDVACLPPVEAVDLLVVDWGARQHGWDVVITDWRIAADAVGAAQPRVILFGPHTDLVAHADARAAGWDRCALARPSSRVSRPAGCRTLAGSFREDGCGSAELGDVPQGLERGGTRCDERRIVDELPELDLGASHEGTGAEAAEHLDRLAQVVRRPLLDPACSEGLGGQQPLVAGSCLVQQVVQSVGGMGIGGLRKGRPLARRSGGG